jgi:hypothetical protein
MWAIECIFYHPTIAAANAQKATWVGKPGYLGGYTRVGVPNSPAIPDLAIGYWGTNSQTPPHNSSLPTFCRLVDTESSLNFILGLT